MKKYNTNERIRKERANMVKLVPQVCFVLLQCGAHKDFVDIEEIGMQAILTYPKDFIIRIDKKNIPDLSLILLVLMEGKKINWGFVTGNWYKGFKLSRKGLEFANEIKRRVDNKKINL